MCLHGNNSSKNLSLRDPLHISSHMHSHTDTHRFMPTRQSHTWQKPGIIPRHSDTCSVATAKRKQGVKQKIHTEKKKSERLEEQGVNSRRDTCGDLMACVSSKEPLISSSGPGVAPVCCEEGVGSSSITVHLPLFPILK